LNSTTLGQLVFDKRGLICIESDAPVSKALQLMKEHGLLSLFVTKNEQFTGIVSIYDIMTFVAFGAFRVDGTVTYTALDTPAGDIAGTHEETRQVWCYEAAEPISATMEALSKGVHRVLVKLHDKGPDGRALYKVVTQTDIIAHLSRHAGEHKASGCDPDVTKDLEELQLYKEGSTVLTVPSTCTALEAFRRLEVRDHTCMPIVDEKGAVITQISASDLRGLEEYDLPKLTTNVLEYLRFRRGGRLTHPVTCAKHTTLEDAMLKIAAAKVHQVWIVDSAEKPIGVVSLTDIVSLYVTY